VNFPSFNLLVVSLAGWLTQHQNRVVDFLMEENRTLHELLGKTRPKLSDRQRRRLAVKAKPIGRKVLQEICSCRIRSADGTGS
jgi:hypothetical protein